MNKRADIGSGIATFVGTIAIVFILVLFVVFSGAVKTFSAKQTKVASEGEIGLSSMKDYFMSFGKIVQGRFLAVKGIEFIQALREAKYAK